MPDGVGRPGKRVDGPHLGVQRPLLDHGAERFDVHMGSRETSMASFWDTNGDSSVARICLPIPSHRPPSSPITTSRPRPVSSRRSWETLCVPATRRTASKRPAIESRSPEA
jgi:hypothetical protein